MKKITVDKIEDGMILGREICGSSGNVLVSKGSPLSAALGRRLANWGITTIIVEGEEDSQLEENSVSISPEKLKIDLMDKFANVIHNPIMKKIFVSIYQYRVEKNI
jgi:hypothetical protein